MKTELRSFEFRSISTGIIEGVVIPYGQRAAVGGFTEEFTAGSIRFQDVIVNLQHDRRRPLARTQGGLLLIDSPEELRAKITLSDTADGRDVRTLIKDKVLRGLSAEFVTVEDEWRGSHRRILSATLSGIGIVDTGAYAGATLQEVRESVGGNPDLECYLKESKPKEKDTQRRRIWLFR